MCLLLEVEQAKSGDRLWNLLENAIRPCVMRLQVRGDNGSELTATAVWEWLGKVEVFDAPH